VLVAIQLIISELMHICYPV